MNLRQYMWGRKEVNNVEPIVFVIILYTAMITGLLILLFTLNSMNKKMHKSTELMFKELMESFFIAQYCLKALTQISGCVKDGERCEQCETSI